MVNSIESQWRLLVLDGHESHTAAPFLDFAEAHKIAILMLPPHTTHLTQSLDVGLFSSLQHYYGQAVEKFTLAGGLSLGKEDFQPLLYQARRHTYTLLNIKKAWKKAGLHPFNRWFLLGKLERPEVVVQETALLDKIPKTTSQLRCLAARGRRLVNDGLDLASITQVINQLEAAAQVAAAEAAIAAHEAVQVKEQLQVKKNWKKSQSRLKASPNKLGRTWSRPKIDRALIRHQEKELEAQRKRRGKTHKTKSKRAFQAVSVALESSNNNELHSENGIVKFGSF